MNANNNVNNVVVAQLAQIYLNIEKTTKKAYSDRRRKMDPGSGGWRQLKYL